VVSPTSIRSRILKVKGGLAMSNAPGNGFTHVDPFEDTESALAMGLGQGPNPLVSPTSIRSRILKARPAYTHHATGSPRFTHVDPFEDTESAYPPMCSGHACHRVSPTSIRSRILKVASWSSASSSIIVSPTSIRSRILKEEPNLDFYSLKTFHPRRSVRGY